MFKIFVGNGAGINNPVHSTDHLDVLHGEAAQAYLVQQNGGHQMNVYAPEQGNVSEGGNQVGMTASFQRAAEGAGDEGGAVASSGGGVTTTVRTNQNSP